MPFSNVYDVTFPPDTQLANLLGSDLRALALNVQQRMASISGLDAAKPNFAGDAQPTNWTGILFFATDTGKVYQFNGATWTDVTTSVLPGRFVICVAGNLVIPATTTDFLFLTNVNFGTPESAVQSVMPVGGVFKSLYFIITTAQPASGSIVITLRINSASSALVLTIPAGSAAGTYIANVSVPFAAGNLVNYQVTNNATANSANILSGALGY